MVDYDIYFKPFEFVQQLEKMITNNENNTTATAASVTQTATSSNATSRATKTTINGPPFDFITTTETVEHFRHPNIEFLKLTHPALLKTPGGVSY